MKNIFLPIKVFILFCMCVWPILQSNTFSVVGIFCFLSHVFFFSLIWLIFVIYVVTTFWVVAG